jgi:hypothetical protein
MALTAAMPALRARRKYIFERLISESEERQYSQRE